MSKVNNKDTRRMSVSIVDFEQVDVCWVLLNLREEHVFEDLKYEVCKF